MCFTATVNKGSAVAPRRCVPIAEAPKSRWRATCTPVREWNETAAHALVLWRSPKALRRRFLLRGLLKVPIKTCSVAALQEALLLMPAGPERYWKRIETAPVGVAVRLIIANRSGGHHGHFPLPHLCRLTATGWINAATGTSFHIAA